MYLVGFATNSRFNADGKKLAFRYTQSAGSVDRGIRTNTDVVDGNWHYCVAVADKATDELRLYVDGSEAAVTVDFDVGNWPNITNTDPLYLGQDNGGGRRYAGLLDDVRLYNRALPTSEIEGIYHCQSS